MSSKTVDLDSELAFATTEVVKSDVKTPLTFLNYLIYVSPCGIKKLHGLFVSTLFFIFILLSILFTGYYVFSTWIMSNKWSWNDVLPLIAFIFFTLGIIVRTYFFYYYFEFLWLKSETRIYDILTNNPNNRFIFKLKLMCLLSLGSLLLWVIYTDTVTFNIVDFILTTFLWYSAYFPEIAMILTNYLYLKELIFEIESFLYLLKYLFYLTDTNDKSYTNYNINSNKINDNINEDLNYTLNNRKNKKYSTDSDGNESLLHFLDNNNRENSMHSIHSIITPSIGNVRYKKFGSKFKIKQSYKDINDYIININSSNILFLHDYKLIIKSNLTDKYRLIYMKKQNYLYHFRIRFLIDIIMLIINVWMLVSIVLNSAFGFANTNHAALITQISVVAYYILIISYVLGIGLDMGYKYQKLINTIQNICDIALKNHKYQLLNDNDNQMIDHSQFVSFEMMRLKDIIKELPLYYDIGGFSVSWRTIAQTLAIFVGGRIISFLIYVKS